MFLAFVKHIYPVLCPFWSLKKKSIVKKGFHADFTYKLSPSFSNRYSPYLFCLYELWLLSHKMKLRLFELLFPSHSESASAKSMFLLFTKYFKPVYQSLVYKMSVTF